MQDEGPGLSAEDQKKLFGKFARLSAKPTGGEHSTGLGLSIVKKMVEAMNGKVWCESELGQGRDVHRGVSGDLNARSFALWAGCGAFHRQQRATQTHAVNDWR